jgi:hypothetical protein
VGSGPQIPVGAIIPLSKLVTTKRERKSAERVCVVDRVRGICSYVQPVPWTDKGLCRFGYCWRGWQFWKRLSFTYQSLGMMARGSSVPTLNLEHLLLRSPSIIWIRHHRTWCINAAGFVILVRVPILYAWREPGTAASEELFRRNTHH